MAYAVPALSRRIHTGSAVWSDPFAGPIAEDAFFLAPVVPPVTAIRQASTQRTSENSGTRTHVITMTVAAGSSLLVLAAAKSSGLGRPLSVVSDVDGAFSVIAETTLYANEERCSMWRRSAVTAGVHNVTVTFDWEQSTCILLELDDSVGALDTTAETGGDNASITSLSVGPTGTPGQANNLVIAMAASAEQYPGKTTEAFGAVVGWDRVSQNDDYIIDGGPHHLMAVDSREITAAATQSITWTIGATDASAFHSGLVAVFPYGAAGGSGATGTVSATEAADTGVITGTVAVAGTVSATQAGNTSAITAAAPIAGTVSATEAADTGAATAAARASATIAATQADNTGVATGTVADPSIAATVSATQDPNTGSAAGAVRIAGTVSATEAADTGAATAAVSVSGTVSGTEAADTVSATAQALATAAVSATQAGNTAAVSGAVRASATVSGIEDADTGAATAAAAVSGTLSGTQAGNTLSASGNSLGTPASGTVAGTQDGNTLAASAAARAGATVSATEAADVLSAQGAVRASGTVSAAQASGTGAATAQALAAGGIAATQADQTLAGSGGGIAGGAVAATQQDDVLSAAAGAIVGAVVFAVEDDDTLVASEGDPHGDYTPAPERLIVLPGGGSRALTLSARTRNAIASASPRSLRVPIR